MIGANGEPIKETVEITVNAFKPVSTFDISQTEGDPIPNIGVNELIGSVDGYEQLLGVIKEVVPVPITFEDITTGAKEEKERSEMTKSARKVPDKSLEAVI